MTQRRGDGEHTNGSKIRSSVGAGTAAADVFEKGRPPTNGD
jgi:hypothetical protein